MRLRDPAGSTAWRRASRSPIRGPYGNGFPVDTDFAGKDLLFIAGGIGLAPLHSVINYCRHYRDRYGSIDIVYGSRSKEDLVDFQEILDVWCKEDGINVHLTIDREQPDWDGHVGFVPNYVKELGFDTSKTVVMCGPPIMIKFTLGGLMELGFDQHADLHHDGAADEVRARQMRPLQHRRQIRLQGRPGVPLRSARRAARRVLRRKTMEKMVTVFLFGKKYEVPASLTIMEAMEYAGYQLVRGCGCRNGFCGACATIYRIKGDRRAAGLSRLLDKGRGQYVRRDAARSSRWSSRSTTSSR